jgi:hypothetical protein
MRRPAWPRPPRSPATRSRRRRTVRNEPALDAWRRFERERGEARLAFSSDFHWLADPAVFERTTAGAGLRCVRGNVRRDRRAAARQKRTRAAVAATGLSRRHRQRSNRSSPGWRPPACCRAAAGRSADGAATGSATPGSQSYGDAESLAGWAAQEALDDPAHRRQVRRWFDEAAADASRRHTCLPVLVSWSAPPGGARHL